MPGDIDQDGDVDRTDAALFSHHFGTTTGAVWTTGDFDSDGKTALADWALLQTHLGQTAGPSPSIAAVPEPSTVSIVHIALLGLLSYAFGMDRFRRARSFLSIAGGRAQWLW
jgi:hypothetical protein